MSANPIFTALLAERATPVFLAFTLDARCDALAAAKARERHQSPVFAWDSGAFWRTLLDDPTRLHNRGRHSA